MSYWPLQAYKPRAQLEEELRLHLWKTLDVDSKISILEYYFLEQSQRWEYWQRIIDTVDKSEWAILLSKMNHYASGFYSHLCKIHGI